MNVKGAAVILAGKVIAGYLAIAFATYVLVGWTGFGRNVDAGAPATDALFGKVGDMAVIYDRQPLARQNKRVILVGASNLILVPTRRLQASLDKSVNFRGYIANNMSVQGVGIPSFRRIIDLAYAEMPKGQKGHNIFVLGVWYGLFCSRDNNPLDGEFRKSIDRFGLFSSKPSGEIIQHFPKYLTQYAIFAIRPFIVIDRGFRSIKDFGNILVQRITIGAQGKVTASDEVRNNVSLTPEARRAAVAERARTTDHVHPEVFQYLSGLAQDVTSHGDRLIIVDLPLPRWHQEGAPAFQDFEKKKADYLKTLLRTPGISAVNLVSSLGDDDFYDTVHPKPKAADALSDYIFNGVEHSAQSTPAPKT